MRPVAVAVAIGALWGCQTTSPFPLGHGGGGGPGMGGGGGGGGGGTDAGFNPDAFVVEARACLTTDLRELTTCASTGAGGLTVSLGNSTPATTNDDGTFTISQPTGTNVLYTITGTNIITSIMAFGATNTVPVIAVNDFETLEDDNGVPPDASSGSIIVAVTDNGLPLANEVATASPTPFSVLYDTSNPDVWNPDDTETHGIVWVANAPPGASTVSVQPQTQGAGGSGEGSGDGSATGITVGSGAITFVQLSTF